MKKCLLIATAFMSFSNIAKAEVVRSRTYFVEINGASKLKEALLRKLTTKPCFRLADIERSATSEDCYAFKAHSKDEKLSGSDSYLFKIEIKSARKPNQPRILSIQGFQNDGEKLTKYFNPGNFSIPSEHQMKSGKADFSESQFIEQASSTIIGLAFK
jgi:hypothetical protein